MTCRRFSLAYLLAHWPAHLMAVWLPLWLLAGCVTVKPYQREYLTQRSMNPGFGDAAELKFRDHWEGARQGFSGGFGTQSGGCGCN